MRILINLATLKIGGGQNVGLNLIKGIEKLNKNKLDLLFIAASGTKLADELKVLGYQTILTSVDPKIRILHEWWLSRKLKRLKVDIVYTVFGYANISKSIPQVCGVADSNLFYPEVDFWADYKGFKRYVKRLIDTYRLSGYLAANGLIFENADIHRRYSEKYPNINLTAFIRPSFVADINYNDEQLKVNLKNGSHVGLFLCGWQFNKGIMKIPQILKISRDYSFDLEIILTAPDNGSKIHKSFIDECIRYGVIDKVHIIGIIDKKKLASLYYMVDYVFLISKLESFSNNIIEAWNYKRLLVTSDLDWARAICRNAALYVNRDDAEDIVQNIIRCQRGSPEYDEIVSHGCSELEQYPNIIERTKQELNFVREVYENIT